MTISKTDQSITVAVINVLGKVDWDEDGLTAAFGASRVTIEAAFSSFRGLGMPRGHADNKALKFHSL